MTQQTLARANGAFEAETPGASDALAREAIATAVREHGARSAQVAAAEFEHAHVPAAAGDVPDAVRGTPISTVSLCSSRISAGTLLRPLPSSTRGGPLPRRPPQH